MIWHIRPRIVPGALVLTLAAVAYSPAGAQSPAAAPACEHASLATVAALPEGSGVVVSRRSPGRLWAHNDSGQPVLIALDAGGKVVGQVRVSGAQVEDWEALSIGPCRAGTCIFIGDIGDNDAERRRVTIYRVPEPAGVTGSVAAEALHAAYPDGPQNAETLLVTPAGELYIVTKGDTGQVTIYRMPPNATPGATVTLQRVGAPRPGNRSAKAARLTDGAISPSGAWIALRTTGAARLYQTEALLAGDWREAAYVDLSSLREPQGEGIAFGDETTIYVVGEGGGKRRPGTLGRLTCALPLNEDPARRG
jgi:hypothetical protein